MADESTPIRAVKGFTVSRWEKLETQVAALQGSKGSILTQRVLSTLGLTERPTPLALNNAQIIKEPYFLLLYGEEEAIHESDLRPKHGAPPAVSQGIKQSLRDAYSTPRHPVNDWAQGQIDRLAIQLLQVFRTYVLIAPTDESGRALPLEPAHVDTLLDHTKATRDAARELIVRLDMDFASKNAGRLAARIFEHTRCLDDKRFAPQDAWLAKKAAGKAHVEVVTVVAERIASGLVQMRRIIRPDDSHASKPRAPPAVVSRDVSILYGVDTCVARERKTRKISDDLMSSSRQ